VGSNGYRLRAGWLEIIEHGFYIGASFRTVEAEAVADRDFDRRQLPQLG
jgi:hypothetical protein